jgi:5-methylcytosine-specific restriction endonuclease McrA
VGFLKVLDERTLAFADFRGNKQYITVGTLVENDKAFIFWCGLYFKHGEDLVELNHIIPTSQGRKDTSTNLQLLHGHCHDIKTTKDGSVKGTPDKSHTAEEPCEGNLARTVLKPSQRGRPR